MRERRARDIMTTPPVTVAPEADLETAARRMLEEDVGSLLLVDGSGVLEGIVTDSDFSAREVAIPFSTFRAPQLLGRWLGKEGVEEIFREARRRQVGEIASRPAHAVSEDASLREVLDVMLERNVKHVPVVREGRPVGMVARHDLLRLLYEEAGAEG